MAITIDYSDTVTPQYVINIPRLDMPLLATSPSEIRELDLDVFRQILNDLMDDETGMNFPTNHFHTAPLTVGGVTLARAVEILAPYVILFENGLYNVSVTGGNSNVADKVIKNQVGVNTSNSAGLVNTGSGLSPTEQTRLLELWQRLGLDPTENVTITDASIVVGGITITITQPNGSTTVTARS